MSSSVKQNFETPSRFKTWSLALMGVGAVSLIIGFIVYGNSAKVEDSTRYWSSLLQNSVYFLLVVNAAMFFFAATTLAWGGWQISFRRVTEAIASCVIPIG